MNLEKTKFEQLNDRGLTLIEASYTLATKSNEVARMSKQPATDEFLTTDEVAEVLRVNVWTVKKMLAAGEFKGAYKLGGGLTSPWRIPRSAVDLYIRERQKQRDRK